MNVSSTTAAPMTDVNPLPLPGMNMEMAATLVAQRALGELPPSDFEREVREEAPPPSAGAAFSAAAPDEHDIIMLKIEQIRAEHQKKKEEANRLDRLLARWERRAESVEKAIAHAREKVKEAEASNGELNKEVLKAFRAVRDRYDDKVQELKRKMKIKRKKATSAGGGEDAPAAKKSRTEHFSTERTEQTPSLLAGALPTIDAMPPLSLPPPAIQ